MFVFSGDEFSAKSFFEVVHDILERWGRGEERIQGRDRFVRDAAGDDVLPVLHVRGYVQRDAVVGDPVVYRDSDGRDFLARDPNTG